MCGPGPHMRSLTAARVEETVGPQPRDECWSSYDSCENPDPTINWGPQVRNRNQARHKSVRARSNQIAKIDLALKFPFSKIMAGDSFYIYNIIFLFSSLAIRYLKSIF